MRILILFTICLFTTIPIQIRAQSPEEQSDIRALTQRIDSLENELAYLKIFNEVRSLYNDIYKLNTDIKISSINVEYYISNKFFKKRYWEVIRDYYKQCEKSLKTYKERVDKTSMLMIGNILVNSFSEDEIGILTGTIRLAENLCSQVESSLNIYKISIDTYEEGL